MYGIYNFKNEDFFCQGPSKVAFGNTEVHFQGNLFISDNEANKRLIDIAERHIDETSFNDLNGQFAIVIFDRNRGKLLLVRDQFGIIPLYYSFIGEKVIFGTTIKSILKNISQGTLINQKVIHEYFMFRYVSGEETIFNNIYEVEPGSILQINSQNETIKKKFYKFEYSNGINEKNSSAISLFEKTFWKSLNEQTFDRDRKEIGVLSSGGVDSSILVSCSSKILRLHYNTYYIGSEDYEHNRIDEVNYLSALYNTKQKNVFISSKEFADHLVDTIRINEEPLNHPSSVLRNYLLKQIKGEVDVLLTGEGADCFYCGYYIFDLIYYFYVKNPVVPITSLIMKLFPVSLFPKKYQHKISKIKKSFILTPDKYSIFHDILAFNTEENIDLLLKSEIPPQFANNYTSLFLNYSRKNILNIILFVYQTLWIVEALNTLTKLEQAHNIEHRHLFINVNMVNTFNKFPWKEKIRFFKRKHQIVELGKKHLPRKFFNKRKEGFGVPLQSWFYDEKGLGRFINLLSDGRTRERGLFNVKYLDQLLDKFHNIKLKDDSYECIIWPIINLELWHRIFIDKDVNGYS